MPCPSVAGLRRGLRGLPVTASKAVWRVSQAVHRRKQRSRSVSAGMSAEYEQRTQVAVMFMRTAIVPAARERAAYRSSVPY